MSTVKLKLGFEAMQILMGELQQIQIQAIYFIGQGQEMPETVTKVDLTNIIRVLCKILGWIEAENSPKESPLSIERPVVKFNDKAENNSEESTKKNINLDTSKMEKNNSLSIYLNKELISDDSSRNVETANIVYNPSITAISEVQNKDAIDPLDFSQEQSEDINEVSRESDKDTQKIIAKVQMVMDDDDHSQRGKQYPAKPKGRHRNQTIH